MRLSKAKKIRADGSDGNRARHGAAVRPPGRDRGCSELVGESRSPARRSHGFCQGLPWLDCLHPEPRFGELLDRMGLTNSGRCSAVSGQGPRPLVAGPILTAPDGHPAVTYPSRPTCGELLLGVRWSRASRSRHRRTVERRRQKRALHGHLIHPRPSVVADARREDHLQAPEFVG